ncbi:MAG: biotin/lipoate A/B protein ligase family protein [Candidatus Hydrogenedentes bacterium]|nr:biotin/lipoate A/B protein ligase family protein [Candidatus Hydrogenedentota bacterium]
MTVDETDRTCATGKPRALTPWPAPMRVLDVSFSKPAENLAYDELLLDDAEDGRGTDTLRIWECETKFVVLGVSQVLREHARVEACASDGVRILRRCSAGGCVLQGPGCLNYSLVISHAHFPEIGTIRDSYCFVLNRLAAALKEVGVTASHKGISDLAARGRKISGNAQRRRKRFMLHHGTLLYGMDPALMERYLIEPADRPQYRGDRTHRAFVRSLPLDAAAVRAVFRRAFGAEVGADSIREDERDAIRTLVKEKYANPEWTARR